MGKFTPFAFILDQWTRLPPPLSVDLSRKTVVVIGANTGIGFETAKHFARMKPARLVLGCRSEAKGKQALESEDLPPSECSYVIELTRGSEGIAQDTGYAAELEIIDLAEFRSVIEFAQRLRNAPVDYLIANAGVAPQEYKLTADTWEQSYVTPLTSEIERCRTYSSALSQCKTGYKSTTLRPLCCPCSSCRTWSRQLKSRGGRPAWSSPAASCTSLPILTR